MGSYALCIKTPKSEADLVSQGPVAQSLVSASRWLRGIKTYRFPWYLTLVGANHASSNPGQYVTLGTRTHVTVWLVDWVLVILRGHCFQVSAIASSVRCLQINLRSFSLFWEKFEEFSVAN